MRYILLPFFALISIVSFAQCDLTIEPNASVSGCMQSKSEARFTDLVHTSFSGNTIKKTSGNSSWNGGALSTSALSGNGFAETVITQTNKTRIFGLSHTNNPNSNNMNSVEYAVILQSWGSAEIRESGSYKSYAGGYSIGDTIRIGVQDGVVNYYKNSTLLYSSGSTPTMPLNVDLAFQQLNGELSNVSITQTTGSTIRAFGDQIPSNNTIFKWYHNNLLLDQTSSEITLDTFSNDDIIACKAIPVSGACSGNTLSSNTMILHKDAPSENGNFYIAARPKNEGCLLALESVIWNANIPENMNINGATVTKTQGYSTSNGGVYSTNKILNNGYLQFSTGETNTRKMVGLSSVDGGNSESAIEFAFYLESGGNLRVYEGGAWRGAFGSFSTSDTMRIYVDNGVVKYFKNKVLLYVSDKVPNLPLIADGTIQDPNATITHAFIANPNQGNFTVHFDGSESPDFEWNKNGISTGLTGENILFENLAENDIISCSYSITISGCGEVTHESNTIQIKRNSSLAPNEFYIEGLFYDNNSAFAIEEIVWNPESLANVSDLGNTLTKIQGYNQFNAGGSSLNTVKNGGHFEYPITETNKKKAVGLSTHDPNFNYSSTNYCMLLETNGKFTIYESGSWRLGNQSYTIGDILKIAVENNVVKYYRNETLVYTSSITPILPLLVDVSLSSEGGSIANGVVVNPNNGKFNAHLSGLGASPVLDWKVNNLSTGVTDLTLAYDQIANADLITCAVVPDFAGCGNTTVFESNIIQFSGPQTFTEWRGTVSSVWHNTANWSYGIPDNELTAKIKPGAPYAPIIASPGSVKNLEVASGASLTITNEASLLVYGNFSVAGSFFPGNGKITFNGYSDRQINGNNLIFNKLIINMTNASSEITISSNISISSETIFIKGKIKTGNAEIVYLNGSKSRSANPESFIDGKVRKVGKDAFKFPVGSGSTYAPIEISEPENATDTFTAEYKIGNPGDAGFDTQSRDNTLNTVSSCEYWILDRVHGDSKVTVSLSYENERSCGIEDPSFLQVLHWNGAKWENKGIRSFEGDAQSGMISSLNPIEEFSPFTIGSLSGINPLPIELSSFTVTKDADQALLKWITETETNNAYFTIEQSVDAVHFHEKGKITGAGTVHQKQIYDFIDSNPSDGLNYYRLSQTDFDGNQIFFPIKSIYFEPKGGLTIFPNPNTGAFSIQRKSDNYVLLKLVDAFGKIQWEESTNEKLIRVESTRLAKGIYFLNVDDGRSSFSEKVIIQ